jgi:hypothetical protein
MLPTHQRTVSRPRWRAHFCVVECWRGSTVVVVSRLYRRLKAFIFVRFRKLFEGWLLPKRKRKALLIGIQHDRDPDTETLAGPHRDVQSLKRLLISEWCYVYYVSI